MYWRSGIWIWEKELEKEDPQKSLLEITQVVILYAKPVLNTLFRFQLLNKIHLISDETVKIILFDRLPVMSYMYTGGFELL